jgi:hypothetical protein
VLNYFHTTKFKATNQELIHCPTRYQQALTPTIFGLSDIGDPVSHSATNMDVVTIQPSRCCLQSNSTNVYPPFFTWWRAPQQMLRTHHSLKAFCATLWWWRWRWAVFLPSFTSNGAPVEWNWKGKTDNSEKNLSQCHFVHHKPQWTDPGSNPGLRSERPATNRLSHGTALPPLNPWNEKKKEQHAETCSERH